MYRTSPTQQMQPAASVAASGLLPIATTCLVTSIPSLRCARPVRSAEQLMRRSPRQSQKNVQCFPILSSAGAKVAGRVIKRDVYQQDRVHLELSISKASGYTWPLLHQLTLRLVSSTLDPGTGEETVSSPTLVRLTPGETTIKLAVDMLVPAGFGPPAALLIDSPHPEEFFLETVTWRMPMMNINNLRHLPRHFWCNSWVTETPASQPRVFFANEVFLPNQTPAGLSKFRQKELTILRGDGTGRRHLGERIYDYDVYNDLGNPDKDQALARPVLGGSSDLPYPRRCRTGRERTATDPLSETPDSDGEIFYVPRDEQFSPSKQKIMDGTVEHSVDTVAFHLRADLSSAAGLDAREIPTFESLEEIYSLYKSGSGFPLPPILKDKDAWWTDEEFARQRLAGLNPLMIERVKEFPIMRPVGRPASAITAHHIQHNLEGMTVQQAVHGKRIFTLDYHDAFLPVLALVNSSPDVHIYATRTMFFLTKEGILKPLAIELASPPAKDHQQAQLRVITPPGPNQIEDFPGHEKSSWLWHLAKAHVVVNDTGYHQLISHWLRTHCIMEPFVIATHRQLSALHPLHRLLLPHLKDTLSINGQARKNLINRGGVIESTFFPHELCMQLSSLIYKNWRFDEQGLPQDLIKRGMAETNRDNSLSLAIKDYPYAVDGLELWTILKTWVRDYVDIYYQNDHAVEDDDEVQKWWKEIKEIGHGDHAKAEWWSTMKTREELKEVLVTIIWLASGHHAAVNFGQYAYAGFMPNSPSKARKPIPDETSGGNDLQELRENPERFILSSLANRLDATAVMATLLMLSTHIEDEFLGEANDWSWTSDTRATAAFRKFGRALRKLEADITARNEDPLLHRNRYGPAQIPYKLLFPSSEQGLTYQGVPNSVSI